MKIKIPEKRFVIGLPILTSNKEFLKEVPPLWEKFFRENIPEKIKNRVNSNILAVYTDYEGDYTKPFQYLIACEVKDIREVPKGLLGKEIAPAAYEVFTAKGEFPQSVAQTWQKIWKPEVDKKRSYTTDFEIYPADFNPKTKSDVDIYIAMREK